jgi:UDP-N-acetylglucosamine 2-epimerase (non-hydrolysing)
MPEKVNWVLTDRPITTTLGTNKLIGIDYRRIPQEVDLVLAANLVEQTVPELWDGKAANRISAIIDEYFKNIIRSSVKKIITK